MHVVLMYIGCSAYGNAMANISVMFDNISINIPIISPNLIESIHILGGFDVPGHQLRNFHDIPMIKKTQSDEFPKLLLCIP